MLLGEYAYGKLNHGDSGKYLLIESTHLRAPGTLNPQRWRGDPLRLVLSHDSRRSCIRRHAGSRERVRWPYGSSRIASDPVAEMAGSASI